MASHVRRFFGVRLVLRLVVALALAIASLPLAAGDSVAQADSRIAVTRLHGPDRYATSLAIARRFVHESGGRIDTAVVVSGQSWRDAAIATALAGALDAPLLLVAPDELPLAAAEFLVPAGVSKVIAIGTPEVLPNSVLAHLAQFAGVERIWRSDPIATSIAVAKRIGTPGVLPGRGRTVVLANLESVTDVHLLVPFAAQGPHPVLLTPPAALDERVKSYILSSGVRHVVHQGAFEDGVGIVALPDAIERELSEFGVSARRYWWKGGLAPESPSGRCSDSSTAGLATVWVPFDAFSAAPLLGKLCAPLHVTGVSSSDSDLGLEGDVYHLARNIGDSTSALLVFGGEAAVPSRVFAFVDKAAARQSFFHNAAVRRAEISAAMTWNANAGIYGVDGNNWLHGPAGFRIDLNDCPVNWHDDTGITQDEIRIGLLLPKSGLRDYFGTIEEAMQTYIDWVNEHDPVAGRQIVLVSRDSADDPARSAYDPNQNLGPLVDSLIKADEVFSVMTMTWATTLGAYERLGDECIPHPFSAGGHAAMGDPVHHPWTTGMTMSQTTEARLWGEWIAQKFSRVLPVKVAALVTDDELSRAYQDAFTSWTASRTDVVSDFLVMRPESDSRELDAEMSEIAVFGPDAFILMTAHYGWHWVIPPIHRSGLADVIESKNGVFIGASLSYVDPLWTDIWWTVGHAFKDTDDPAHRDEPFVGFMRENLGLYLDTTGFWLYDVGYRHIYPYVEALRIAATLPGGLTRTNFILAVRSLDITHPLVVDGVRFAMNGNDDAFFIEGARFRQVDAEAEALKAAGPVIDINGQTPNCAWDRTSGRCQ